MGAMDNNPDILVVSPYGSNSQCHPNLLNQLHDVRETFLYTWRPAHENLLVVQRWEGKSPPLVLIKNHLVGITISQCQVIAKGRIMWRFIGLFAASMIVSLSSYADVYVSPYQGDGTVEYSAPPKVRPAPVVNDASNTPMNQNSNLVRREDLGRGSDGSSGRDVPLRSALELIYPSKTWKYNIDPELGDNPLVSWQGDGGANVVQSIAKQNGLYIAVNADENTVGVSSDSNIAHLLANRIPKVWFVSSGTDLHSLVKSWAVIAEKKVGFAIDDNYLISYPAIIEGSFVDALNQLLASVADERVPMIAKRSTNNVFTISRGGWQAP